MDRSRTQSADTSLAAERQQFAIWRRMSAAEKVQVVRELTRTVRQLALSGIQARHPDASEEEVGLRLASFWLDRETMIRFFDWDPEVRGIG